MAWPGTTFALPVPQGGVVLLTLERRSITSAQRCVAINAVTGLLLTKFGAVIEVLG
jgi:hypothetical protein